MTFLRCSFRPAIRKYFGTKSRCLLTRRLWLVWMSRTSCMKTWSTCSRCSPGYQQPRSPSIALVDGSAPCCHGSRKSALNERPRVSVMELMGRWTVPSREPSERSGAFSIVPSEEPMAFLILDQKSQNNNVGFQLSTHSIWMSMVLIQINLRSTWIHCLLLDLDQVLRLPLALRC